MHARVPGIAAAAGVALVTVAARLRPLANPDVLWQVPSGEAILARRALLSQDLFTSTLRGAPIHDHEPAGEVLLALIHRLGGLALVWWFGLVAAVLVTLISFRAARGITDDLLARLIATCLVVVAVAGRIEPRPEWAAFGAIALAHALRRRGKVWAAPLVALLAPFHALVLLVAVVPIAHAMAGFFARRRDAWIDLAVAAVVPVVVAIVAPQAIPTVVAHARASAFLSHVIEYYGPLRFVIASGDPWPFVALGVAAVAVVGLRVRAREGRAMVADALLVALLCVPGVVRVRFAALPLIAAMPWIVGGLGAAIERLAVRASSRLRPAWGALACGISITIVTAHLGLLPVVGFDFSDQPEGAVQWMTTQRPNARLFHSFNFGAYLIYRGFPASGVMIDPRAATVYPDSYARAYYDALGSPARFQEWAARDGFDTVLLHRRHRGSTILRDALASDPRWKIAWSDHVAIVFVRR
ncbi:MAG: hypothetical protein ACXVEE_05335 [Polyangiales bacterium]